MVGLAGALLVRRALEGPALWPKGWWRLHLVRRAFPGRRTERQERRVRFRPAGSRALRLGPLSLRPHRHEFRSEFGYRCPKGGKQGTSCEVTLPEPNLSAITPTLPPPLALNVYRVSFNGFTPAYAPPRAASSSKAAAAASVRGSSKSARAIAGLKVKVSE